MINILYHSLLLIKHAGLWDVTLSSISNSSVDFSKNLFYIKSCLKRLIIQCPQYFCFFRQCRNASVVPVMTMYSATDMYNFPIYPHVYYIKVAFLQILHTRQRVPKETSTKINKQRLLHQKKKFMHKKKEKLCAKLAKPTQLGKSLKMTPTTFKNMDKRKQKHLH